MSAVILSSTTGSLLTLPIIPRLLDASRTPGDEYIFWALQINRSFPMRLIAVVFSVVATIVSLSAFAGENAPAPSEGKTIIATNIGVPAAPRILGLKLKRVGYCDEDNDDGAICARRGCACGGEYDDFPCCNSCYTPPGNTYGECE
jgi:hypothetical protein